MESFERFLNVKLFKEDPQLSKFLLYNRHSFCRWLNYLCYLNCFEWVAANSFSIAISCIRKWNVPLQRFGMVGEIVWTYNKPQKILNYEKFLLLIRHLYGSHLTVFVISMVLDGAASCLVRLPYRWLVCTSGINCSCSLQRSGMGSMCSSR